MLCILTIALWVKSAMYNGFTWFWMVTSEIKVNESWYKQCGVTPHFYIYWKKFEKVNIDTIKWEKLFDRSTGSK